jgi:hypothetical protein
VKATQVVKIVITRTAVMIEPEEGGEWPDGPDIGWGRRQGTHRVMRIELLRTEQDGDFTDEWSFTSAKILKNGGTGSLTYNRLYDRMGDKPQWLKSAMAIARVEAEAA